MLPMFFKRGLNFLRFQFHQKLRWSRPGYQEIPLGDVSKFDLSIQPYIQKRQSMYNVTFEKRISLENARDNYFYFDLLQTSRTRWNWTTNSTRVLDVGSKNFYYADALENFFKPQFLTGIEVDGYTIYSDVHSRKDYADYYLKPYSNAEYIIADFLKFNGKFDVITCFYPFVFPETATLWCLPLSFFDPTAFFKKIESLLEKDSFFWMLNHGEEEWIEAQALLTKTNLKCIGHFSEKNPLSSCDEIACVSLWKK